MVLDPEVYINYAFLARCRSYDLSATEMSVYLILVGWTNTENGLVTVPQRVLSTLLGVDPDKYRSLAQRTLRALERLGLIIHLGSHKDKGTNIYEVVDYHKWMAITPTGLVEKPK